MDKYGVPQGPILVPNVLSLQPLPLGRFISWHLYLDLCWWYSNILAQDRREQTWITDMTSSPSQSASTCGILGHKIWRNTQSGNSKIYNLTLSWHSGSNPKVQVYLASRESRVLSVGILFLWSLQMRLTQSGPHNCKNSISFPNNGSMSRSIQPACYAAAITQWYMCRQLLWWVIISYFLCYRPWTNTGGNMWSRDNAPGRAWAYTKTPPIVLSRKPLSYDRSRSNWVKVIPL